MSDEKTEMPTPKRLRDARKKGQVAYSKDATSTLLLVGIFAYIGLFWRVNIEDLREFLILPARYLPAPFQLGLAEIIHGSLTQTIRILLPVLGIVAAFAIAGGFMQVGAMFSGEAIKPDLKKLNPVEKFKQIFSKKNFFEFFKSTLKVIFLGILIYKLIKNQLHDLILLPYAGADGVIQIMGPVMKKFAFVVIFAYGVVAVADVFFQRRDHTKKLMMSKDEVKREYKEMEGNPEIKGKRKQLHREMLEEGPAQRTRKSSALITNPTHLAIAILYDEKTIPLPIVTAKGEGLLAEAMMNIARTDGIPIIRNVPLAHALMNSAEELNFIPSALLEPVAEVLRWLHELTAAGKDHIEVDMQAEDLSLYEEG